MAVEGQRALGECRECECIRWNDAQAEREQGARNEKRHEVPTLRKRSPPVVPLTPTEKRKKAGLFQRFFHLSMATFPRIPIFPAFSSFYM